MLFNSIYLVFKAGATGSVVFVDLYLLPVVWPNAVLSRLLPILTTTIDSTNDGEPQCTFSSLTI